MRPNHVYVITPNTNLAITQGLLAYIAARLYTPTRCISRSTISFRSLAADRQAKAIGIVLSGTGSDGTLGLCEIKVLGGITFAQD